MNKKQIEISKSSLLSLKAEVLRKQEEVFKAKLQSKCQQAIPKPKPKPLKNIGVEDRNAKDLSEEDIDALSKSKQALEAKSKLYDHLSKRSARNDPLNKQFLVQFDRKFVDDDDEDDVDKYPEEEEEEEKEVPVDPNLYKTNNPDEEWVDYVDCLGRTRKCLRKDLPHIQSRDKELSESLPPDKKASTEPTEEKKGDDQKIDIEQELKNIEEIELSENNEMLSHDMRRELLRKQWEQEEEELRSKSDIHYQDVLFNEARTHGVGYFSFSKDDKIRKQQQEQLKKLREETKQRQSSVQEQRALREQQLAARAKAARNRKRARMGLPPEEEEEEKPIQLEPQDDTNKVDKEALLKKEEEEKAKELERKKQVRPWDIGKKGTREIKTQEEWVEEKREERKKEFAPPTMYSFDRRRRSKSPEISTEESNSLYFTSKRNDKKPNWRNYSQDTEPSSSKSDGGVNPYKRSFEPTPIVNLLEEGSSTGKKYSEESSSSDSEEEDEDRSSKRKRAEIPPPPTFEYYGPTSKNLRPKPVPSTELKASIEAGLKFLRKQSDKKHAQTDHVGYFD